MSVLVRMDVFDLLDWMDGCAGGSHLRQGIWPRAIDRFFKKLNLSEREKIYTYAKRDLLERFVPRVRPSCTIINPGLKEFLQFLSRYNPNNQYVVELEAEKGGKLQKDTAFAYKYEDSYYINSQEYCAPEAIKSVNKTPMDVLCNNEYCQLKDTCARYDKTHGERRMQYINCDEYIYKDTTHGVDPKFLNPQK